MMARFLTRSQLAQFPPVLGHYYRSLVGLFSTMPHTKIPAFGNPNKYRKRMEQRNEKHRKVQQLARNVVILSCDSTAKGGVCDVYVVGTTHSQESCREVQAVVNYLKPEVLFLELCEARSSWLQPVKPENTASVTDLAKDVMGKRASMYDAYRVWNCIKHVKKFKIETSEFCAAYEEAKKYGSKVVLGGRPREITSNRMWKKMSLWQKTCELHSGYYAEVFKGTLKWEVWVDERDKYMAHRLLEVARKNSSVVAIVGRAHLEGIKNYWKQPIMVEDLMTVPPPSNSYLECLGVVVVGVATIILVIYFLV